jgi:Fe-S-cluster containining protein
MEHEHDIARIPSAYVDDGCGRMKCHGDRCSALQGEVGVTVSCAIYRDRPEVCRSCEPGDDACRMARRGWNL